MFEAAPSSSFIAIDSVSNVNEPSLLLNLLNL